MWVNLYLCLPALAAEAQDPLDLEENFAIKNLSDALESYDVSTQCVSAQLSLPPFPSSSPSPSPSLLSSLSPSPPFLSAPPLHLPMNLVILLRLLLLFNRRPYIREQLLKLRKEKFGVVSENDGDDFAGSSANPDLHFSIDGKNIVLAGQNPFEVSPYLE